MRDALCDLIMLITGDNEMRNTRNFMDKQIFVGTYAYREPYLFNAGCVTRPKFNTVTLQRRIAKFIVLDFMSFHISAVYMYDSKTFSTECIANLVVFKIYVSCIYYKVKRCNTRPR